MTAAHSNKKRLRAGEFFGDVSGKMHFGPVIVTYSEYNREVKHPEHSHELAFFTLMLNGTYFDKVCGKEASFDRMTTIWREPGLPHKDRIGGKGGRFFFVEIQPDCFEKLLEYGRPPSRHISPCGSLSWLALRLRQEVQHYRTSSALIVEGIALEMLGYLTSANPSYGPRPPSWLAKVSDRLREEFSSSLTIDDLAREAGVHPSHLTRTFRNFYKRSIGEYIQELKVESAAKLLSNSDMPLVEIAIVSGFSDQSHLTRIFKRMTGSTPDVFRKSNA